MLTPRHFTSPWSEFTLRAFQVLSKPFTLVKNIATSGWLNPRDECFPSHFWSNTPATLLTLLSPIRLEYNRLPQIQSFLSSQGLEPAPFILWQFAQFTLQQWLVFVLSVILGLLIVGKGRGLKSLEMFFSCLYLGDSTSSRPTFDSTQLHIESSFPDVKVALGSINRQTN